ncbi:MAG: nucleotidyl transferase AbiEii/AbiGii toxin family protein [Clostridia bacterium]
MYFHLDKENFADFLETKSTENNIEIDILEKDYYVCEFLKELSKKQNTLKAYFKGGTAIYKILHSHNRFSEDIDLTVCKIETDSNNSNKTRLEKSAFDYNIPGVTLNKERSNKSKDSVIASYDYETIYYDIVNSLQRSGEIQIEATSFTVSEPTKKYMIEPLIYTFSNDKQKEILDKTYNIKPFELEIIALERIFIDKIFAIEFYYIRDDYIGVSKHLYDICFLFKNDDIQNLLNNNLLLTKLISYKRKEETIRIGGIDKNTKIIDFRYFKLENIDKIELALTSMQDKYVINTKYKIDINSVKDTLKKLYKIFSTID